MTFIKPISLQKEPEYANTPQVFFNKKEIDSFLHKAGYNVFHEKALECPCKFSKENGFKPLSSCLNCGGVGWVFLNKVETKGIIHSMNKDTKFKEWSRENTGTASLTLRDIDRPSVMDRITVIDGTSEYHETVFLKQSGNRIYFYTSYRIKEILFMFLFVNSETKLTILNNGTDYEYESIPECEGGKGIGGFGNKVTLSESLSSQIIDSGMQRGVSLRYTHQPQYNVVDIPRDTMVAVVKDDNNRTINVEMPIHAIMRKSHYILDAREIGGSIVFDNSIPKGC